MLYSILFINPNSSVKVTENLKAQVKVPPGINVGYYTAPPEAPKEIDGTQTSLESERIVLDDVLQKGLIDKYDGFLIGCYSDHPLIHSLAKHTKKPILGIMQATLLYALLSASISHLLIITSVNVWEELLDTAILRFLGSPSLETTKFLPTKALDVNVLNLAEESSFKQILLRVKHIFEEDYKTTKIDCVLLGCAGMAGLDSRLSEHYPNIQFVDSVKVGVEILSSLVRFHSQLA